MAPSSFSYGETKYWDDRYSKEEGTVAFDWYQRYDALSPVFDHYLRRDSKILVVGCGNSALSEDMSSDGYEEIVNVDISPVVIEAMKAKNEGKKGLSYSVMDVRDLKFPDSTFDAIIDKGTLDSLMCGENSVDNAHMMLTECLRVLKPSGVYLLITYGDPKTRMSHLEQPDLPWSIHTHAMPRPGAELVLADGSSFSSSNSKLILQSQKMDGSNSNLLQPLGVSVESGNLHFIYACRKAGKQ